MYAGDLTVSENWVLFLLGVESVDTTKPKIRRKDLLFATNKKMLLKCCTQYVSEFGKLSSGHRTGKGHFFIPIPKKGDAKEWSNYHTIVLISPANKVMLKLLQARLQQYLNQELPDVQAGFRKGRGTRDQIANIRCIIEKAREFQKII